MPRNAALRDELLALTEVDEGDPDADARLIAIMAAGDWPGLREVGPEATDAAWMLVHRADHLNGERRTWLSPLRAAVEAGEADPRHYATLVDRVAASDGQPQEYGTLATTAADGEVEFRAAVREAGGLDERRLALGLPTVAQDAPHLGGEGLLPYAPDRGAVPVNQWPLVLEGHVSVEAALEAGIRLVHRIWAVRPGDRRLGRLRALARERGVLIDQVEEHLIAELAAGRSHGGVIGLVGPRRERRLEELLPVMGESPMVVMLDGVEDPFNYGQAVRALYASGVDAVVVRRTWETALATVTRASAGASELLPTGIVDSVENAATLSRRAGMRVACAVNRPTATDIHQADLTGGLFVLIGGERRGVTRSFIDEADVQLRIGYGRERAPELGAAASAAIIGFEALRQRRASRPA